MSTPTHDINEAEEAWAAMMLEPREGQDTLTSIVEELSCWPDGTTVPIHGLADRLRPLIGREGLDSQQVAWTLDLDGRYTGEALSPELTGEDASTRFRRWLEKQDDVYVHPKDGAGS